MTEAKEPIGVGIIGSGGRGVYCVGTRMAELVREEQLVVKALCDRNPERMQEGKAHLEKQFAERGVKTEIECIPDYRDLIADPRVGLVMVSTTCDAHRDPALAALASGKKVYLDKPIAADLDDSIAIIEGQYKHNNTLMMGFSRRYEPAWRKAHQLLDDGVIGDLCMLQIRAVIPYWRYFQGWWRRRKWSGGALNDKSSHHYDVLNWFAQSECEKISAFGGRTGIFKPDPDGPKRCLECDRECPYRHKMSQKDIAQDYIALRGKSWLDETEEKHRHDNCVYLPGSDIHDHVISTLAYENGVKASLFWAIFGPGSKNGETLELVGSKGRMILTRKSAEIDLATDYGKRQEIIDCKGPEHKTSHYGADRQMVRDIRRFVDGHDPVVSALDGYKSTRMIMATHKSVDSGGDTVSMKDMPSAAVGVG